jgi:hypothetical protein
VALVLSPPPVHALVTVDDRSRMRLTSSRHRLTVVRGRTSLVLRIEAVNRGGDPHDVAIRRLGGRRLATTGVIEPGGPPRRFRVRLKPGRYVLYCTIAAGTPLAHEARGMRDALRVVRRS